MVKVFIWLERPSTSTQWLYETTLDWFVEWTNHLQTNYKDKGLYTETPYVLELDGLITTFEVDFPNELAFQEFSNDPIFIEFQNRRDQYYAENNIQANYAITYSDSLVVMR